MLCCQQKTNIEGHKSWLFDIGLASVAAIYTPLTASLVRHPFQHDECSHTTSFYYYRTPQTGKNDNAVRGQEGKVIHIGQKDLLDKPWFLAMEEGGLGSNTKAERKELEGERKNEREIGREQKIETEGRGEQDTQRKRGREESRERFFLRWGCEERK